MLRLRRLAVLACGLLSSCGNGSNVTAVVPQHDVPPHGYTLDCDLETCPSSIGLFVGPKDSANDPMHCTAVLLDEHVALTAGHCVGGAASACEGGWVGFAPKGNGDSEPEWVPCKRVQFVQVPGNDRAHLEPDYAVLELARPVARNPMTIASGGPDDGEVVTMLSVQSDRYYEHAHRVRSRRCRVGGSHEQPAPNGVHMLSACPIELGESGSPLISDSGELLGIVHAGTPPYFAVGVMTAMQAVRRCTTSSRRQRRAKCFDRKSSF